MWMFVIISIWIIELQLKSSSVGHIDLDLWPESECLWPIGRNPLKVCLRYSVHKNGMDRQRPNTVQKQTVPGIITSFQIRTRLWTLWAGSVKTDNLSLTPWLFGSQTSSHNEATALSWLWPRLFCPGFVSRLSVESTKYLDFLTLCSLRCRDSLGLDWGEKKKKQSGVVWSFTLFFGE